MLLNGLTDSFNILEITGALKEDWGTQLDLATSDAENTTILEPYLGMWQKMQRPLSARSPAQTCNWFLYRALPCELTLPSGGAAANSAKLSPALIISVHLTLPL